MHSKSRSVITINALHGPFIRVGMCWGEEKGVYGLVVGVKQHTKGNKTQ
jgi:hypothetical protein